MSDTPVQDPAEEVAEQVDNKQQEVLQREPLEQKLMQQGESEAGTEIDDMEHDHRE